MLSGLLNRRARARAELGGGGCYVTLMSQLPKKDEYRVQLLRIEARFPRDLRRVTMTYRYDLTWLKEDARLEDEFHIPYPSSELSDVKVTVSGSEVLFWQTPNDNGRTTTVKFRYEELEGKTKDMRETVLITYTCPTKREGLLGPGTLQRSLMFHVWAVADCPVEKVLFIVSCDKGMHLARLNPMTNPPVDLQAKPVVFPVERELRPGEYVSIVPVVTGLGWLTSAIPIQVLRPFAFSAAILIGTAAIAGVLALVGVQLAGLLVAVAGLLLAVQAELMRRFRRQGGA